MKKYDSVIFDLDGTLWSSLDSAVRATADVKSRHEDITYDTTSDDVKAAMGLTFDEARKFYYGYLSDEKSYKYTKEAFERNVEYLSKGEGKLYPDVVETLDVLSKNYKLFIVSNCALEYIRIFFKTCGLEKYFLDYECGGTNGFSKAENIKMIIERNGLNSPVYVGDTIHDKEASRKAGVPFIYASYGFGDVSEYDYKIDKFKNLSNLF